MVKLLLGRADVEADSKNRDVRTPLFWAVRGGHEAVVKLLKTRA
jgi:ankyrin repeat protein